MRRRRIAFVVVACAAALAAPPRLSACTTVLLACGEDVVVAKSYDYYMGQGHLIVNPRGLVKRLM